MTRPTLPLLLTLLCVSACNPKNVDETGYLQPPEIDTSAEEEPQDEEDTEILVVGNPGALLRSGGVLTVSASSGAETTINIDDPAGSFVATLLARRGDTLALHYELEGSDSLELALDGTAVSEGPSCLGCLFGNIFAFPDADGFTSVALAMLDNPSPPYTLLNQTRGIAVRTTSADGLLKIPAASGDRACIFRDTDALDETSRATCDLVP